MNSKKTKTNNNNNNNNNDSFQKCDNEYYEWK